MGKARVDTKLTRLERLERSHGRIQRVLSGTITKAESYLPKLAAERNAATRQSPAASTPPETSSA